MVYGPDGRGLAPAHKGAKVRRPPGPARCPASKGSGPRTSSACPCHSHGVTAGGCDSASPGTAVGGGVPALARAEAQRAPWGGPCPGSPSPGRRPPDRPMGGSGRAAGPRPLGVRGRWPAGAPKPPGWLRGDSRPRENMAAPPGVLPEVRAAVAPAGHGLCCCSVPPRGQCFRCCPDSVQRGMGPSGADGGDLWPPNGASGLCSGRARPPRTPGEYTQVPCPDGTLLSRLSAERPGARPSCTFKAGTGVGGGHRGRLCPAPARSPLPRARTDGLDTRERSASLDGR